MLTPEQYKRLEPYRDVIRISNEINACLSSSNCNSIADIYESEGWGHINRTCSGCLTDMNKTVYALIMEYEGRQ